MSSEKNQHSVQQLREDITKGLLKGRSPDEAAIAATALHDLEEQFEALRWHARYVVDMHPEREEYVDHKSMRRLRNTLASFPAKRPT